MNYLSKIWTYGTRTPIQRIGVLVLILGLISAFSWMNEANLGFIDLFDTYYFPGYRDSYFYHLYLYFVPVGLFMSWGYKLLQKIKLWVSVGSMSTKPKPQHQPNSVNQKLENLYFKDSLSAFKYAVPMFKASYTPNQMSFGMIKDSMCTKEGNHYFLIQLADGNNTTLVYGYNEKYINILAKGDLVYWGFLEKIEGINGIDAFGAILATLHPECNPHTLKWKVKENLTE